MIRKKDLPLAALKILAPYITSNDPRYHVVKNQKAVLRFEDSDPDSRFYFEINEVKPGKAGSSFAGKYYPASEAENQVRHFNTNSNGVLDILGIWISVLEGYEDVDIEPEDPILKQNEEEFSEILRITDEDAERVGFNLEQIEYLDHYLTNVAGILEAHKEEYPEEEIVDLKEEVESIREVLTKETKSQIVSRLSKFFAKCKKAGLPIIKEVLVNVLTEFTKNLMLGS